MVRKSIPPAPYKSPVAIPPGETIKDVLDSKSMSQKELALRMGRPPQEISYIINGKRTITPETAKQLEYVLGIKASFWLNIERGYQETRTRLMEEARLAEQVDKVKNFPYSEMSRLGYVETTRKSVERVQNLLSFFRVATFEALDKSTQNVVGANLFRRSSRFNLSPSVLAVWLRMGEIAAIDLELNKFNPIILQKKLDEIRALTLKPPKQFVPELRQIGSECGVGFIFVRELKKLPVWGLTRWMNNRPYVQLNLRYKTNDHLWFSLFHEIGHVLNHKNGDFYINLKGIENTNQLEAEADKFASDTLIPTDDYKNIRQLSRVSKNTIVNFADQIGIAPGIVVGRLQHDKIVPMSHFNDLKIKYIWVNE